MKISRERLEKEAGLTGFRPEILEKVLCLIDLLQSFSDNEYLSTRIALKGGTALNLFCFECPRLSVDIDLNYIGSVDRENMLDERLVLVNTIKEICIEKGYLLRHTPQEHAGGKWILRYHSVLQGNPRLAIDLNFLTRVPLWLVEMKDSFRLGSYQVKNIPVIEKHELAGGKLKALFSRHSSRDLFDVYSILIDETFDIEKLRIAFLVYGGMSRKDWLTISAEDIDFEWSEFKNMLLPMLRRKESQDIVDSKEWANKMVLNCRQALSKLSPLRQNEHEFMNSLLTYGEIKPELLSNPNFTSCIQRRLINQ